MKNLILIIIITTLIGCNDDDTNELTTSATILSNGWTGCEYILQFENQEYHFAENLPEEFQQNNLVVTMTYSPTNNIKNCGFSGGLEIIEILNIEEN